MWNKLDEKTIDRQAVYSENLALLLMVGIFLDFVPRNN